VGTGQCAVSAAHARPNGVHDDYFLGQDCLLCGGGDSARALLLGCEDRMPVYRRLRFSPKGTRGSAKSAASCRSACLAVPFLT
jgi:hypothetical protein